jgi:hypothetical protein
MSCEHSLEQDLISAQRRGDGLQQQVADQQFQLQQHQKIERRLQQHKSMSSMSSPSSPFTLLVLMSYIYIRYIRYIRYIYIYIYIYYCRKETSCFQLRAL